MLRRDMGTLCHSVHAFDPLNFARREGFLSHSDCSFEQFELRLSLHIHRPHSSSGYLKKLESTLPASYIIGMSASHELQKLKISFSFNRTRAKSLTRVQALRCKNGGQLLDQGVGRFEQWSRSYTALDTTMYPCERSAVDSTRARIGGLVQLGKPKRKSLYTL